MKKLLVLLSAILSLAASPAGASVLTIDQGPLYSSGYDNGGMGSGRGLSFLANQNFNMTSLAIDLNVRAAQNGLRFDIFSSTNGHSAGGLLSSLLFNLNAGSGYQDQAFNYSFQSGNFYVINFRSDDNNSLGSNFGTKYVWDNTGFYPLNYGAITVIEGFEGASPDNSNPLIAFMRFNGDSGGGLVPEPASIALLGLGLVALGFSKRKKQISA